MSQATGTTLSLSTVSGNGKDGQPYNGDGIGLNGANGSVVDCTITGNVIRSNIYPVWVGTTAHKVHHVIVANNIWRTPSTSTGAAEFKLVEHLTIANNQILVEGAASATDIGAAIGAATKHYRKQHPGKFGPMSLDAPLRGTEGLTLLDVLPAMESFAP